MHGQSVGNHVSTMKTPTVYHSSTACVERFEAVKIDTGANLAPFMGRRQYGKYCQYFNFIAKRDATQHHAVRGIGGPRTCMGTTIIQIPFTGPGFTLTWSSSL